MNSLNTPLPKEYQSILKQSRANEFDLFSNEDLGMLLRFFYGIKKVCVGFGIRNRNGFRTFLDFRQPR